MDMCTILEREYVRSAEAWAQADILGLSVRRSVQNLQENVAVPRHTKYAK